MHRRRAYFHRRQSIPYSPLFDPALHEFFSRSVVKSHLTENGWFESFAQCSICQKANRGELKICTTCGGFYHVTCLLPRPLFPKCISLAILIRGIDEANVTCLKDQLLAQGFFTKVDLIRAAKGTNYRQLELYDSYFLFQVGDKTQDWDSDTLGDYLADLAITHRRGIVVGPTTHSQVIGGKFRKYKMSPLLTGRPNYVCNLVMGRNRANHAVFEEVDLFVGGDNTFFCSTAVSDSGSKLLARWSNGFPLLAISDNHPNVENGKIIALNYMPIQNLKQNGAVMQFWDNDSDSVKLVSNALRFVANVTYLGKDEALICNTCKLSNSPKRNFDVCGQPYKDFIDADDMKTVSGLKHVSKNGTKIEIEALKEKFRLKFREQIEFSKHTKANVALPIIQPANEKFRTQPSNVRPSTHHHRNPRKLDNTDTTTNNDKARSKDRSKPDFSCNRPKSVRISDIVKFEEKSSQPITVKKGISKGLLKEKENASEIKIVPAIVCEASTKTDASNTIATAALEEPDRLDKSPKENVPILDDLDADIDIRITPQTLISNRSFSKKGRSISYKEVPEE